MATSILECGLHECHHICCLPVDLVPLTGLPFLAMREEEHSPAVSDRIVYQCVSECREAIP